MMILRPQSNTLFPQPIEALTHLPSFTAEQVEKFKKRVDNGYDIFIYNDFVLWLRYYHPYYLPINLREDTNASTPTIPNYVTPQASLNTPVSHSLTSARKVLSDVSEFLTFPCVGGSKKSKPPGHARVLTSEESLTLLKEKEQKKKDEEQAKQRRKIEREEKRVERETTKKRKAEIRERKAIEKKSQLEEQKAEKQRKAEERINKAAEKRKQKNTLGFEKTFVTRNKSMSAPQRSESESNECMLCFGNYCDDLSDDGTPTKEWVQCTNEQCSKWMHEECSVRNEEGLFVCTCAEVFMQLASSIASQFGVLLIIPFCIVIYFCCVVSMDMNV